MSHPKIIVGIYCESSIAELQLCLSSVFSQSLLPLRVVLVGAQPAILQVPEFQSWLDQGLLHFHCDSELDFGQAQNWVIRHHDDFDYYLCLSSSVQLAPDFLQWSYASFRHGRAELGAVNGLVCYMSADGQRTETVYSRGLRLNRIRVAESIDLGLSRRQLDLEPEFVFGPSPICCLLSAEMIREVLLPSAELFESKFCRHSYAADLAWRMGLHGWKTLSSPDACAWLSPSAVLENLPAQSLHHRIPDRTLMVLRNEQWSSLFGSLPAIAWAELAFVLRHGIRRPRFFVEYLSAIARTARLSPHFWRSRADLQIKLKSKPHGVNFKPRFVSRMPSA